METEINVFEVATIGQIKEFIIENMNSLDSNIQADLKPILEYINDCPYKDTESFKYVLDSVKAKMNAKSGGCLLNGETERTSYLCNKFYRNMKDVVLAYGYLNNMNRLKHLNFYSMRLVAQIERSKSPTKVKVEVKEMTNEKYPNGLTIGEIVKFINNNRDNLSNISSKNKFDAIIKFIDDECIESEELVTTALSSILKNRDRVCFSHENINLSAIIPEWLSMVVGVYKVIQDKYTTLNDLCKLDYIAFSLILEIEQGILSKVTIADIITFIDNNIQHLTDENQDMFNLVKSRLVNFHHETKIDDVIGILKDESLIGDILTVRVVYAFDFTNYHTLICRDGLAKSIYNQIENGKNSHSKSSEGYLKQIKEFSEEEGYFKAFEDEYGMINWVWITPPGIIPKWFKYKSGKQQVKDKETTEVKSLDGVKVLPNKDFTTAWKLWCGAIGETNNLDDYFTFNPNNKIEGEGLNIEELSNIDIAACYPALVFSDDETEKDLTHEVKFLAFLPDLDKLGIDRSWALHLKTHPDGSIADRLAKQSQDNDSDDEDEIKEPAVKVCVEDDNETLEGKTVLKVIVTEDGKTQIHADLEPDETLQSLIEKHFGEYFTKDVSEGFTPFMDSAAVRNRIDPDFINKIFNQPCEGFKDLVEPPKSKTKLEILQDVIEILKQHQD